MTTTHRHTRSSSRVQFYSRGAVPFSWEKKPGVSKLLHTKTHDEAKPEYYFIKDNDYKLPPPPMVSLGRHDDYQLPLPPPCSFQTPAISRSSSLNGLIGNRAEIEDPFQVAILECTKSILNDSGDVATKGRMKQPPMSSSSPKHEGRFGSGVRSFFGSLSCKCSSSVRDDSLVKVSRVPYHRDTVIINF